MRAPDGLDAAAIAERVGRDVLVPTISVETQQSGPRMTLGQWAEYFEQQPGSGDPRGRHRRQPLLNVVSLSLAGTPLQVRAGTGRTFALNSRTGDPWCLLQTNLLRGND